MENLNYYLGNHQSIINIVLNTKYLCEDLLPIVLSYLDYDVLDLIYLLLKYLKTGKYVYYNLLPKHGFYKIIKYGNNIYGHLLAEDLENIFLNRKELLLKLLDIPKYEIRQNDDCFDYKKYLIMMYEGLGEYGSNWYYMNGTDHVLMLTENFHKFSPYLIELIKEDYVDMLILEEIMEIYVGN